MRAKILFFTALIIFVFENHGHAQVTDLVCSVKTTAVYFGNGVLGSAFAQDAINEINSRLRSIIPDEEHREFDFKTAINQSESLLLDILESARQTLGNEYPILLVARLLGVPQLGTFLDIILPSGAVQEFNDRLKDRFVQEFIAGAESTATVGEHLLSYTSDITEGKKVVLVAHSQGNIYGNLAAERLSADQLKSFGIVPVASPESFVRKSLVGHVRFSDDLIIGATESAKIALGLPAPLSANDEDNVDAEPFGHFFLDAYMADISASGFILNGILTTSSGLEVPSNPAGQGIITVTLTWGANPDIDLHVFEPDGTHVYYAALVGNIGFLDVDDVSSFGPEHYFASCNNLRSKPAALGTYRVGVNYFSGSTPETANITVKAPGVERSFSTPLSSAVGTSGDPSPVPVANIIVSQDPTTGILDFVVQ